MPAPRRIAVDSVPVPVFSADETGRILDANAALVKLLGYESRKEVLALRAPDLYMNREECQRWHVALEASGSVSGFATCWRRRDGSAVAVCESGRATAGPAGTIFAHGGVDISASPKGQGLPPSPVDPFTGLHFRQPFNRQLQELIDRARRHHASGVLMLFDVHNLRAVNEAQGFRAGDDVILLAAQVLSQSAPEGALVGRIGGDAFALAALEMDTRGTLRLARRIRADLFSHVLLIAGRPFPLEMSCGLVSFPGSGIAVDDVLRAGERALSRSETRGDNGIVSASSRRGADRDLGLANRQEQLIAAIQSRQFVAFAQPIYNLAARAVSQRELLVRLAVNGTVQLPVTFLPLAERLDLVHLIDTWMFRQGLEVASQGNGRVHVNLSAKTIDHAQAMAEIAGLVSAHPRSAGRMVIEVTESASVTDLERMLAHLEALRSGGCQVALDDFGAGFSSMVYLRHLPPGYLKIDSSFIRHLATSQRDRAIVRSMVDLAHALGHVTVAEGIETQDMFELVSSFGVDLVQGYLIGRPAPVERLSPGPSSPDGRRSFRGGRRPRQGLGAPSDRRRPF